jgi:trimeric autotransporter adhesin
MGRHALGSIVACALAVGTQGCTSSQTSTAVTSPASVKCQVQVGSPTTDFTSAGGKGTLAIATTRDCTWSVSTSAAWVSVSNTSGQGEASVPYAVAANPMPLARAAQIAVSDATLQLSQDAAPCQFALSSSSASIAAAGGPVTVQLNTLSGCAWTARTDASWLTITSGATGNTTGSIAMSAAANTGAARTAHMIAGGLTFTVTQAAGHK